MTIKTRFDNSAQQVIEYVFMVGGILAVLAALAGPSGNAFRPAIDRIVNLPLKELQQETYNSCIGNGCTSDCGDQVCDSAKGESCSSCDDDCGYCVTYCGDGTCDPNENATSCGQDC